MNVRRFVSTSAQVDQGLGARNTSRIQGGFDDFWEYLELYEIEGERYISLHCQSGILSSLPRGPWRGTP